MYIKALSVTEVTEYIKRILSSDIILNNISIKGEISNFKHHYSGHMYFTLKDDNCKIKCVMFKSSCLNLKFLPQDGMKVIASGTISLYERDGQYQLYVNDIQPDGKGALYAAFEQLKKKLEEEGLFDMCNKLPIPKYPSKIGVVTSSTGAAVRDIINVLTRRYPGINIIIVPVAVQGSEAPGEITKAIEFLNKRNDVDVIITGRGGGSIEELWAFNEECVARAIYNSKIPVISAVGHETDFTIADFVSDLRAPTPSAAAELSVPDKNELRYKVNSYLALLCNLLNMNMTNMKNMLKQYENKINIFNPVSRINQKRQRVDSITFKLITQMKYKLDITKERLERCSSNLNNLSPLSVIFRGYSIVYQGDSKNIIDDISKVKLGDKIDIVLKNGKINCRVENIHKEDIVSE